MQFLQISPDTTLSQLTDAVGGRNVESVLHINSLTRTPDIGRQFQRMYDGIVNPDDDNPDSVSATRKASILNRFAGEYEIFQSVALLSNSNWKFLSATDTLPGMLQIPESIQLPDSANILSGGGPVPKVIYKQAIAQIKNPPHYVDPGIFNAYSTDKPAGIQFPQGFAGSSNPMQWFVVPWGEVTLHSSISDDRIDFPVYPEELSDGVKANYTQMPDLLYQYEPWQIYTSSGPRTQTYTFSFHRDMWTGDHRDGEANKLIRACMANCYPEYRGSAVYTSTVTLYISGQSLISGILTDVNVNWDGPIGLDGWYLHCKLELTITEVSKAALNYFTVKNKSLIE